MGHSMHLGPLRIRLALRSCHTHCGRGVYELAPVHRIGPDYAVRAHRLEHDSSADSHDILYPLASIERLHIFSVRALDLNWSVEQARFHEALLAAKFLRTLLPKAEVHRLHQFHAGDSVQPCIPHW